MKNKSGLIGFDLRLWEHPGIGRYIRELVPALLKMADVRRFCFLGNASTGAQFLKKVPGVRFENASSKIYSAREQWELRRFSRKVDLLHVPHFNAPVFCASKLIVTVHDLIYLKPELQGLVGNGHARSPRGWASRFYAGSMMRAIEKSAKAVIAVSDFTRKDLVAAFPKLEGRVQVIHEAVSAVFTEASDAGSLQRLRERYKLERPFVLFVGSLKAHKNIPVLLDAFQNVQRKGGAPHELLLAGRKDPKESALLKRIENSPGVRYLGEVPDADLRGFYRTAEVLVIPSLWEGFGFPALEGMACGTPVLCSDRASLPEVVGDAALTFDPTRVDRLSELLYDVLQKKDLRQKLSALGLERSRRFSWENAARETLELYNKVLN